MYSYYQCTTCNKSVSRKCHINVYIRTHTGENPFECTTCHKSFSDKSNLNRHILTHTGRKPYQCTTCQKWFSGKDSLDVHIFTHTGERHYKCTSHSHRKVVLINTFVLTQVKNLLNVQHVLDYSHRNHT